MVLHSTRHVDDSYLEMKKEPCIVGLSYILLS